MKKIIYLALALIIMQKFIFAFGGKIYHRIALDKLNLELEYLEKKIERNHGI